MFHTFLRTHDKVRVVECETFKSSQHLADSQRLMVQPPHLNCSYRHSFIVFPPYFTGPTFLYRPQATVYVCITIIWARSSMSDLTHVVGRYYTSKE